jgi:hypothetical protein
MISQPPNQSAQVGSRCPSILISYMVKSDLSLIVSFESFGFYRFKRNLRIDGGFVSVLG